MRHCLCGFGDRLEAWAPVPRHELVPAGGGPVAGDLGDVSDIGLRLDPVELAGLDDCVDGGGAFAAGLNLRCRSADPSPRRESSSVFGKLVP
jgi:hypothetical protein